MKWYTSICLACGLALVAPQFASAGPNDPPKAGKDMKGGKDARADKDVKPDKGPKVDEKGRKPVDEDKDKNKDNHGVIPGEAKRVGGDDHKDNRDVIPGEAKRVGGDDHKDNRDVIPGQDKKADNAKKPKVEPKPVSDDEAKRIAKNAKDSKKNSRGKLKDVKKDSEDKAYTCAQVKDILESLHNDFDRIEFASSVYDNVIDKEHWDIIYSSFKSGWPKQTIEKKIAKNKAEHNK